MSAAEIHAYGKVVGCVGRRSLVVYFSSIVSVLLLLRAFSWATNDLQIFNTSETPKPVHGCTGIACYEVLTCFGMRETTMHFREPVTTITGFVLFPFGAIGAYHGLRWNVQIFGMYLLVLAFLHLGCVVADVTFIEVCAMYPSNLVHMVLTEPLLPVPMVDGAKAKLLQMKSFPVEEVAKVTGDFDVLLWYMVIALTWALLLLYMAGEVRTLGTLLERGPLGIGVNFGLDQWDQIVNHDAIRIRKNRECRSRFVEDADESFSVGVADVEAPFGYPATTVDYGTAAASSTTHAPRNERLPDYAGHLGWQQKPDLVAAGYRSEEKHWQQQHGDAAGFHDEDSASYCSLEHEERQLRSTEESYLSMRDEQYMSLSEDDIWASHASMDEPVPLPGGNRRHANTP